MTGQRMKRGSYRDGVYWIAHNDEAEERDPEIISGLVTVLMLADMFEVDPERVARDVVRQRKLDLPTMPECYAR